MMSAIEIRAHAKINLCLEITGKRPDGYHEINSVFHAVSLADTLELSSREDDRIVLHCDVPHIPVDGRNLVIKAALALRRAMGAGPQPGADIVLRKTIPAGAGLGGGASDAAATLRALCELWSVDQRVARELPAIAAAIGSDVPFFLSGGTCLVSGRGEIIEPLACPQQYHFIIVFPGFPVSTAWAYKMVKNELTKSAKFSKILSAFCLEGAFPATIAQLFYNDLEIAVIPSHPQIQAAKSQLTGLGAINALMSGSGSSVFGIFSDQESARTAFGTIKTVWPSSYLVSSV